MKQLLLTLLAVLALPNSVEANWLNWFGRYGSFSEFEMMVKKVDKEQGYVFCSDLEIVKVNEHKAMILMNCPDLKKFGAMLEQPELKQWDIDNNCVDNVDKVYNPQLIE